MLRLLGPMVRVDALVGPCEEGRKEAICLLLEEHRPEFCSECVTA